MPGKPVGQIDVEVVRSFIRELGCHICQWTPASIQGEYATLNKDQHGQNQSPVESAQYACDGQQDNASGESRPNHSVQELIAVNIEILAVSDPVSTWSGASALREFLPPLGASGPRRSRQSCRAARTTDRRVGEFSPQGCSQASVSVSEVPEISAWGVMGVPPR